mgnify:CR=1 FL=1
MTPALARLGQAVRERLERDDPSLPDDEAAPSHLRHQVVIAGFGRVGQLTAEVLTRHGVPYVAVEQDANRVAHFRNLGLPVYYGNAARPELLHRMQAEGRQGRRIWVPEDPEDPAFLVILVVMAAIHDIRRAELLHGEGLCSGDRCKDAGLLTAKPPVCPDPAASVLS